MILIVKAEGKILLGRPKYRWKDKNSIDLKEIRWADMNWI
jgi:hypothetical protein